MKHRNPFTVLFLSIITLGVYDLYWLVKTKKVLNQKTRIHTPSILLLIVPYVFIIALIVIFSIINSHTTGINGSHVTSFSPNNAAGVIMVLGLELTAFIILVPITFYWFFKFSKAINEYTEGELSTGVTFLLLWLLHFIGVIIVQDKFNDMLTAGQDNSSLTSSFVNDKSAVSVASDHVPAGKEHASDQHPPHTHSES